MDVMKLRRRAALTGPLASLRDVKWLQGSPSFYSAFKKDYCALHAATGFPDLAAKGDDALAAGNYDLAIELYSTAIHLDLATDAIFANRSKASAGKMLWDDALLDAEKVQ
jgi:hypothetical protein